MGSEMGSSRVSEQQQERREGRHERMPPRFGCCRNWHARPAWVSRRLWHALTLRLACSTRRALSYHNREANTVCTEPLPHRLDAVRCAVLVAVVIAVLVGVVVGIISVLVGTGVLMGLFVGVASQIAVLVGALVGVAVV
jgi:hypothetical protein